MYCVRNVTEDLYWVGANDHRLTLFENIHPIPRGVPIMHICCLMKRQSFLILWTGLRADSFWKTWIICCREGNWTIW